MVTDSSGWEVVLMVVMLVFYGGGDGSDVVVYGDGGDIDVAIEMTWNQSAGSWNAPQHWNKL